MAATTGLIAIAEVALYAYVGALVDRMNALGTARFLAAEGPRLAAMAALVLLGLPLLVWLNSAVQHQTLLGNFPMRIRWNVHRYLLRQSMGYFQDEFAGRIATKLMQTSLAVRETVVKLFDIGNYVLVYFGGTLVVAASADWRLMLPFAAWLACYALLMRWFVPRMGKVSQQQADARSSMTGRIVDSYTNIATVKLFSHSRREQAYAREAMDGFLSTVYRQMRLATSVYSLLYALNIALLFAVGALGTWLWLHGHASVGASRGGLRAGAAPAGHVALDHVGTVGAVREHRHRARWHLVDFAAADGGRRPPTRHRCPPRAARSASATSRSTTARAAG